MSQGDLFEAPTSAGFALRPYQREAVDAIHAEFERVRSTLLVFGTGLGKTVTFGTVACDYRDRGLRTIVIAHSVILVDQAYESLRKLGLRVGFEQADRTSPRGGAFQPDAVIATVQTMTGRRLERYSRDHFGLVCVDECHRALASQHRDVMDYFASAKVLGVSATPDRADKKSLANVFDSVALERDMLWGISNGYLARVEFRTCVTGWDPKQLKEVAGEVESGSVERELLRAGVLTDAATTLAELGGTRRTVAFLPTVASARAFSVELAARGIASGSVDGETPPLERQKLFRDLREGRIQVLCNCAVLVEGFDVPEVDTIALLAPTKARGRLAQCIGRGVRLAPGKESCLVLDFVPGRMKRGRLASPADALAGRMLDDETIAHVRDGDLVEALERAEKTRAELDEMKSMEEERARAKADRLAAMRSEVKTRDVDYSVREHDAGEILGGSSTGVSQPEPVKRSVRLDDDRRRKIGMCSEKQGALLAKHGLDPNMKRNLAREAIDAIAANRWKLPDNVRTDPRFYAKGKAPVVVDVPAAIAATQPANDNSQPANLAEQLLARLRAK